MTCDFAQGNKLLQMGRICKLDKSVCFNYDRTKLAENCPTRKRFESGKVIGGTPAINYAGMPKCFRGGPYGTFNGGMPPNYLRGELRRKKK